MVTLPARYLVLIGLTTIAMQGFAQAQSAASNLSCTSCHKDQAEHQPHTPMGMAIELPPDQGVLEAHPLLTYERNGFSYKIERKNGQSTYTVTDGKQTLTLPIQYVFGVGMETFVLKYEDHFYESLVSYYPALSGLSTTMGDEQLAPRTIAEGMGRRLETNEVTACFGCHSSAMAGAKHATPDSFVPGLSCEHCHAGAQTHMNALAHGHAGLIPKRLGAMGAENTSEFCGTCHRDFDTVVRMRSFGPVDVRFQPYRLAKSPCFNGADPRISCTACHDSHRDLVTDAAAYDSKCLACHQGGSTLRKVVDSQTTPRSAKACPVAQKNCVTCHMPKTELPGSHTQFTDHMIRIVKPGEPYPE